MKCIINGKIILPDSVEEDKVLLFDNKIIGVCDKSDTEKYAGAEIIDAKGNYVAPGLVDVHIHGYMGEDVSEGSEEGITKICSGILENGVTSWCPTTMTVSIEDITAALNVCRRLKEKCADKENWNGAEILGVNTEGPFINPVKKGAQNGKFVLKPDAQFVIDNKDIIKLVTIAPEMEGACEAIKKIKAETDVTVSMGHSDATYEDAVLGIEAGASHVTHLFNAMSALNHRNPGLVGAGLSGDVSCELIGDTFHVSKHLYKILTKLKGDKLCLITDCLSAAGLPEGEYVLGGQKYIVKGIECRLTDGVIAGSVLKLNNGVKNLADNAEIPIYKAVAAASLNPATAVGISDRKGSLEKGKDADIIFADDNFNIKAVFTGGYLKYDVEEEA